MVNTFLVIESNVLSSAFAHLTCSITDQHRCYKMARPSIFVGTPSIFEPHT